MVPLPSSWSLFLRPEARAGRSSGVEYCSIHSSMVTQVVPRAARPVSMPRWPPGTISKRTSWAFGSSLTIALTAFTGAMPSVLPAKISTGTLMLATSISCPPDRLTLPVSSWLCFSIRW